MRAKYYLFTILLIVSIFLRPSGTSAELSGEQILEKSDAVVNASQDMVYAMEMKLIDKEGNEKIREAKMMQKGTDKRMFKFLTPADVKGVGVLTLEDDIIYLYMPAFHKIRRIASHVKNDTFMGTDFTYDDMSTMDYHADYDVKDILDEKDEWVLILVPKKEKAEEKDYSQLKMWVRKIDYYQMKIEYYDRSGKLRKVMDKKNIEKIGKYIVAKEMKMKDLKKDHSTIMSMKDIKFDNGLTDKDFSKRKLKRN